MSDDEFRQMMAAASAEFRASLVERIAVIDALWARITDGNAAVEQMEELILLVHKIAGSAGTFGFDEVGDAAAAAEARLTPYRGAAQVNDAAARADIDDLLDSLRRRIRGAKP